MLISIIIPTLNEACCIAGTLASIRQQQGPFEIIVADGGSSDETIEIAILDATIVTAPRGRAHQMNAAAEMAKGEILLFLHADTHLPPAALDSIRNCISQGSESGIFRLQFDRPSPLLHFYSFCTRFNFPRFCFGDRAIFIKQWVFEEIGRFPAIPIFEDLEITHTLHRRGTFAFLKDTVVTAARRFESNGPLRQQVLNTSLWIRYLMGTSPFKLAHRYSYEKNDAQVAAHK